MISIGVWAFPFRTTLPTHKNESWIRPWNEPYLELEDLLFLWFSWSNKAIKGNARCFVLIFIKICQQKGKLNNNISKIQSYFPLTEFKWKYLLVLKSILVRNKHFSVGMYDWKGISYLLTQWKPMMNEWKENKKKMRKERKTLFHFHYWRAQNKGTRQKIEEKAIKFSRLKIGMFKIRIQRSGLLTLFHSFSSPIDHLT